jgi:glycosyltransferase involved in cell wall biosynthesis
VEAARLYQELAATASDSTTQALLNNDRAVLAALAGDTTTARRFLREALTLDERCTAARANLALLESDLLTSPETRSSAQVPIPSPLPANGRPVKVAILSFLFNWPSTGGGIVHTVELAQFLACAGYDVRHFYARYQPWEIGRVSRPPIPSVPLDFTEGEWALAKIKARYRAAVDAFAPDYVLVTDSWNMKPQLADAMRGYPTLLRFAALECLCPLNNVRLLASEPDVFSQCPKDQLRSPRACHECISERGRHSGGLHRAERELAGVDTPGYDALLRRALAEAEAVLVLNPDVEALLKPYAGCVQVVPWGMDSARFPWPWPHESNEPGPDRPMIVFQAGLIDEPMKGFPVLHAACARLWERRHDFQLHVTSEPPGRLDPWTEFIGWKTQSELPRYYHEADIVVVPTIAQEGLSRTSVEAMAAGKPVIASRIGGLPYTLTDGETGLLYEPGNSVELAAKLQLLLDQPQLRRQLGQAGRRRFEEQYTWPAVIERYYRPLLVRK